MFVDIGSWNGKMMIGMVMALNQMKVISIHSFIQFLRMPWKLGRNMQFWWSTSKSLPLRNFTICHMTLWGFKACLAWRPLTNSSAAAFGWPSSELHWFYLFVKDFCCINWVWTMWRFVFIVRKTLEIKLANDIDIRKWNVTQLYNEN